MKKPNTSARSMLSTLVASAWLAMPPLAPGQTTPPPPPLPQPGNPRPPVKTETAFPGVEEAVHHVRAQVAALGPQIEQALDVYFTGDGLPGWHRGGGSTQPLVIAPSGGDSTATVEDLQIMSRLLQKTVQNKDNEPQPYAMGIPLFSLGGAHSPQALYIEGHGAIFVLRAPFPLKAPEAAESSAKPAPAKPSAWEQTRRELYGPKPGGSRGPGVVRIWDAEPGKAQAPYDPEQVERLRKVILESLKHANNIRALKREDSVTVLVSGPAARKPGASRSVQHIQKDRDTSREQVIEEIEERSDSQRAPSVARLGFKARKTDIEAFAAGSLTFDDFRNRAQVWED